MPSTVESDTTTSVARVADGGIVVREEHSDVELFSVTPTISGIAKYATAMRNVEKLHQSYG